MATFTVTIEENYTRWKDSNGKTSRPDGPAFSTDKFDSWAKDGLFHRTDGPAIEYKDGRKEFWIEGVRLSEEEFNKKVVDII